MISGILCLAAVSLGVNLLANPSFEEVSADGRPTHWSPFVMPQPGAVAEVDRLSRDGVRAAMLHVPNPYEREPANNWSQVIVADVGGRELVFGGEVRTEAAGEAALWLQCFSRNPARVVAAATSATERPLSGTRNWTPLEVRVTAPEETEFVVVRCVLKGRGSAWFDKLHVEVHERAALELPALEPGDERAPATPAPQDLRDADLMELSRMLKEAVAELAATNARILERVQQIQAELAQGRPAAPAQGPPAEPTDVRHPLVPHGWTPKGVPR